ncbi:MAG: HPr kinase/phosphorylase [Cypionkella sp.]
MILHASCVAVQDHGLLILGPSGAGKSALALQLLAFGANLVSDDQTEIWAENDRLFARPPAAIQGLIEARNIGILHAPYLSRAEITLVADLGQTETERLPPFRHVTLLGLQLPLVLGANHSHFPFSILCYLKGSRFA